MLKLEQIIEEQFVLDDTRHCSLGLIKILDDEAVHVHVEARRGHSEQPCRDTAMHVNVLEPFHDASLAVRCRFEVIAIQMCFCSNDIVIVLREFVVFVVYEGVGELALLRIVSPFLYLDQTVPLGDQW